MTRHLKPVFDVSHDFFPRKRLQAAQDRYALPKLRQARTRQLVRELGLAGENDLNQLRFGRLEVG